MKRSFFVGLILPLLISGGTIDAALIYDQGAPDLQEGFEITHFKEADQFTLSAAAILGNVKFWDIEASADFQSSILWEIRANSQSNLPGAVLFSGTSTNLTHVATGRDAFGYLEFVDSFDIGSVSLPAGTYWLVLHNGPLSYNENQNIFWETVATNRTDPTYSDEAPFMNVWDSNFDFSQMAFQLNGVPESLRPRVTALGFNINGAFQINFTTVAGQHYRVDYKNNMTDASWTIVSGAQSVAGTGAVVQVTDPDPTLPSRPRRFYRVVLL